MRAHDRFREMLARRSELSGHEEMHLQQHLRECADCGRLAEDYARQTVLLRSLPEVDPPPSLRAGVLRRLEEPVRPPRRPYFRSLFFLPAAAVMLMVVMVLASGKLWNHQQRPQALDRSPSATAAAPSPLAHVVPPKAAPAPPSPLPTNTRGAPRHVASPSHIRKGGRRSQSGSRSAPHATPTPFSLAPSYGSGQPISPPVVSQRLNTPIPAVASVPPPLSRQPARIAAVPTAAPRRAASTSHPVTAAPTATPRSVPQVAAAPRPPTVPPAAAVTKPTSGGSVAAQPPGVVAVTPSVARYLHPPSEKPTPPPIPQPTVPSPPPPNPAPTPAVGAPAQQAPIMSVPTPIP